MKHMKPFDLEAAMRGEPIVTRDGRKARFIAHVPEASEAYRVVVFIEDHIDVQSYFENGHYAAGEDSIHADDILMAPPPMHSINGHEYPEPVREALEVGQSFHVVDIGKYSLSCKFVWSGDAIQLRWLRRGLIHLTREAADAHATAIVLAGEGEI